MYSVHRLLATGIFHKKRKKKSPDNRCFVGYENNRAEFDSGVIVDFGAYNLQADEKLSVRSLCAKNDGDYEAVAL